MNLKEAMSMKATLESKGEVEFEVCTLEKTVTIKKNMVSISKEINKEKQVLRCSLCDFNCTFALIIGMED